MTKIPRSIDNNQRKEMDNLGIANSRKVSTNQLHFKHKHVRRAHTEKKIIFFSRENCESNKNKNKILSFFSLFLLFFHLFRHHPQSNYKNQKPILEKRRRDRINGSLDELKNLLLAIKQRDVSNSILILFVYYQY